MCLLLFDVFKTLRLRKTDVLKIYRKRIFAERKFEEMHSLERKNVQGIIGKTLILALLSSVVFRL